MDPLLLELAKNLDRLVTREQILGALADLQDAYDSLGEIEQEAADRLIEELNRRLKGAAP